MASLFPSTNFVNKEPSTYNGSLAETFNKEMDRRKQQDLIFAVTNSNLPDSGKNQIFKDIVDKMQNLSGHAYVKYLLDQIYSGSLSDTNKLIHCSSDLHKGPFMFDEDRYFVIYGEETEKKIKDNCNNELIKSVNGTEVTKGMLNRSNGEIWVNGLIAYDKNSIIVRDNDNTYGQPGFCNVINYYNRISVNIFEKYVIPELIKRVNRFEFNSKTLVSDVHNIIIDTFDKVHREKMAMINGPNVSELCEAVLFGDAPLREELHKPLDEKDIKIFELEKKLASLTTKVNTMADRIAEIEEMYLDVSIKMNKGLITEHHIKSDST